jgi:hypothetical protein
MFYFLPVTSKTGSKLPFMKEKPFSLAITPDELSNCTQHGKEVFTSLIIK